MKIVVLYKPSYCCRLFSCTQVAFSLTWATTRALVIQRLFPTFLRYCYVCVCLLAMSKSVLLVCGGSFSKVVITSVSISLLVIVEPMSKMHSVTTVW